MKSTHFMCKLVLAFIFIICNECFRWFTIPLSQLQVIQVKCNVWLRMRWKRDKCSCAHRKRLHASYFCNTKLFKWLSRVSVSAWTERCSSRSLTSLSITTVDVFWTGLPEEKHKERQWTDFQNAGDNANSHVYDGESGWTGKATHWIISLCICRQSSTNQPNPVQLTEILFIVSYARHYELWQKC